MSLDEAISGYIKSIYESPNDDSKWARMVDQLLELTDCHVALISAVDTRELVFHRMTFAGAGASDRALQEYRSEMYLQDPSLHWAAEHPHGRFCDTSRLMPADEYRSHPLIRWNLDRLGSSHWYVGYSHVGNGLTLGVSLHPPASVGPLPEATKRLFRMLYDHIEHAVALAARPIDLEDESDAVILLDCRGEIWRVSPAAAAMLAQKDGISSLDGRLKAVDGRSDLALQSALGSALTAFWEGGSGGAVLIPRSNGHRALIARISPLPPSCGPAAPFQPTVLVRLIDPKRATPGQSVLYAELFKLTRREAEVAQLLIAGHSVESISASLEISPATARVHLGALFKKTMTSRQIDLVRVLNSLA